MQCRMGHDRAEVAKQVELGANSQQAQFGPFVSRISIPLRPPDGAQQGRIRISAGIDGRRGQRVSGGVDRGSADQLLVQLYREAVEFFQHIQYAPGGRINLRTDAISRQADHPENPLFLTCRGVAHNC